MHRVASFVVACIALAGAALAAAPSDEIIQGLYEGAAKGPKGTAKIEARLVACGKGTFKLFVRELKGATSAAMAELDGQAEGDAVLFQGKAGDAEWKVAWAGGALKGTCGQGGTLALKRAARTSPTMGAKPPAGAVVLLDGKNFDEVTQKGADWQAVEGGGIQVPKGGMNSKRQFPGSLNIHVEFKIPFMPNDRDQGRGNSGVYLPNGDEIQVLDSFGMTTYTGGGCGGLYKYKDPDTFDKFSLAALPPLQWQTYDIEYRVEMKDGKPTGKPRVTVLHNGIKIHDNAPLEKDARPGGMHFQDHGNAVHYRNIWVVPLGDK